MKKKDKKRGKLTKDEMYKLASLKNPKVSPKVMNSLNTIKQKYNEKQLKDMILSEESK